MDTLTVLFFSVVFIFAVSVIAVLYLAWVESRFVEKRTIKKRLLYISAGGKHGRERLTSYRESILKDVGTFERFVLSLPRHSKLDKLLIKTKLPINATLFVVLSATLCAIGFIAGVRYLPNIYAAVLLALLLLILPYLLLKLAEKQYYIKFGDQLPEALDLLSRAVRSGNSLTAALGMIADELDDPISAEFAATVEEINLGLTLKEAMENLCERVPMPDLRFFAIAVLVQKETGGNIGEILNNISRLIRERIQFQRQVRAMTAEGRYSAAVLIGLPIFMFFYIYLTNYDYLSLLWKEQMGHYMLFGGIILQFVGAYLIKRIVTIEI
jgi:tight adherence protein B